MFTNIFAGLTIQTLIARVIVLMTAIPVHEAAHAWAADKMGDPTARYSRRISLNPLDHIDPIGAIMILVFGFGFARPVPVNSMHFKDRTKGIIVTSLAGPVSNILMALICLIFTKLMLLLYIATGFGLLVGVFQVFSYMVSVNLSLAVFNLLPLPPLDGFHAICPLLPRQLYWRIQPYEQQMIWIILILVATGVLSPLIRLLVGLLFTLLNSITFFLG